MSSEISPAGVLIPVPWETRNLQTPSYTIHQEFVGSPAEGTLRAALELMSKEKANFFVQARVLKTNVSIIPIMQRCGFYYVESTLGPQTQLEKSDCLKEFLRSPNEFIPKRYSLDQLEFYTMDKADDRSTATVREIARGSFSDDRFHLDPCCSKETADQRFVYWVDDLLSDPGTIFYVLNLLGKTVSFMVRKEEDLILAGFDKQHVGSGLGDLFWLSVMKDMVEKGLKRASTTISANNVSVINLYVRLGYKFANPAATFHYWKHAGQF